MENKEPNDIFDDLVSDLTSPDRRSMLERISQSFFAAGSGHGAAGDAASGTLPVDPEEVDRAIEEEPEESARRDTDLDAHFQQLPFLRRLVIILAALFSRRDRYSLIEDSIFRSLERKINAGREKYVDMQQKVLLPDFCRRAESLKRSLDSVAAQVRAATGEGRAGFLVYLAGVEMPEFIELLMLRTDPATVAEAHPNFADIEIKRYLEHDLDNLLSSIPAESRNRLYRDARSLAAVTALCACRIDRLIAAFDGPNGSERTAEFESTGSLVADLVAVLGRLREGVPFGLVKGLALYFSERGAGGSARAPSDPDDGNLFMEPPVDSGGDSGDLGVGRTGTGITSTGQSDGPGRPESLEGSVRISVGRMLAALHEARTFLRATHLVLLARCVTGRLSLQPDTTGGGEEWVAEFRRYWRERVESQFRRFSTERKREALLKEARELLDGTAVIPISSAGRGQERGQVAGVADPWALDREGRPIRTGIFAASMLRTYFLSIFASAAVRPFKTLLIDGQFYKDLNRAEFTDAFGLLQQARVRLERTEVQAGADVRSVVQEIIEALRAVCNVVHGVLFGEVGGRFDSISNRADIAGRSNKQYLKDLESALRRSQEVLRVASSLLDLDIM